MLKQKIKRRIRNFLTGLDLPHLQAIRWQLDDISAQTTLNNSYQFSSYFPQTNWSLRPATLVHILNDITINQRKRIVDFGCGASTIYMAKHIKCSNLDAKIYAIDESQEWIDVMLIFLKQENLDEIVTFVHAPLAKSELSISEENKWYNQNTLKHAIGKDKIDLAIVDGPVGNSSPFARYGAIPFLKEIFAERYSVFLDDADRKEELIIVNQWEKLLNVSVQDYNRYKVFTTDQQFSTRPLFKMYDKLFRSHYLS
ncbi:class I SAM-dependent methyltransferase [Reichenbachiella carrageenanivorans]|uniref:Class I SAM-dependent methyltransferase n=1 Tax=Reichenbachiella carrageenanivorans TaxID=2979869 RepID=A0ABY6D4P3_9BACT|nr:class I SAM-dependent methyltransferase [Reichenbachiella carrageenanivorans]UXX81112.1 class I SAM-dependent methyltransferase [Reichenbachiella carrageenanivorans]